jgi:hypothetical protein
VQRFTQKWKSEHLTDAVDQYYDPLYNEVEWVMAKQQKLFAVPPVHDGDDASARDNKVLLRHSNVYLVKWCKLTTMHCTWEDATDLADTEANVEAVSHFSPSPTLASLHLRGFPSPSRCVFMKKEENPWYQLAHTLLAPL